MPGGNVDKVKTTHLGALRADHQKDLKYIEDNLKLINKPTLIAWGENDVYIPLSLAKPIHQGIEGSKMEIIPNCGHFLQEDESKKLTNIIVNIIDLR